MNVKTKIQQNLIAPADHNSSTYTTVAQVLNSNEKANTADIKYTDKEGYIRTKLGVPVKIYNTAMIDWFPTEGEPVVIAQSDNYVCITSKYEGSYTTLTRASTSLKNDIFGESFSSIVAGFIL